MCPGNHKTIWEQIIVLVSRAEIVQPEPVYFIDWSVGQFSATALLGFMFALIIFNRELRITYPQSFKGILILIIYLL